MIRLKDTKPFTGAFQNMNCYNSQILSLDYFLRLMITYISIMLLYRGTDGYEEAWQL